MDAPGLFSVGGKVAVVTGGSRGIGLMIAEGLVSAGATVYISSRKADVCDAAAVQLSAFGRCVSIPADLSTEAGCDRLAAAIAEREPKLHILVNNAGATWGAPLLDYPTTRGTRSWRPTSRRSSISRPRCCPSCAPPPTRKIPVA